MERARPTMRERDEKDPRERDRSRHRRTDQTVQLADVHSRIRVRDDAAAPQAPEDTSSRIPRRISRHARRALIGGLALTGAALLTGCDSVSGIPGDEPGRGTVSTTTAAAAIPTAPVPTRQPTHDIPVGEVTGLPGAAQIAAHFGSDVASSTPAALQSKCWMLAPGNIIDISSNKQAVLTALAQPGTATQTAVTWKSAGTTVTFDRTAVESGIKDSTLTVCPSVAHAGTAPGPNEADARHTVRRYLARFVGSPLDPSDKEAAYPLVCKASPANWDPTGTGEPIPAPLANNPGKLTGATKFADQEILSERLRADYVAVQVPVTNSAGVTQTRTFTLTEGPEGYCIGDVSP